MNIDQLIEDFNSTLSDLIDNIASICPDNIIADNRRIIKRILSRSECKSKAIDTFIAKVLIYKPQIDSGNEDFFLGKSYEDDLADTSVSELTGRVFEFKNIWKTLSADNKKFVIQYMQLLCLLAQNYFLLIDSNDSTNGQYDYAKMK